MSKMINNSDKHKLQIVALISFFILACVLVYVGTRHIPLRLIGVITLMIEILFLMPQICGMYCNMYEMDPGAMKYVPVLNFVQIFNPLIAKITVVVLALVALFFVGMNVPMTFVASILGENIAMAWTGKCFVFLVIAAVFLDICIGIGYCDVLHGISTRLSDLFGMSLGGTTWLYRIMLFMPIIRVSGLIFIYSQLVSLRIHNYGNKVEYNDEYFEEEM